MFPAGAAGFGLLILRLCVAGTLLHHIMPKSTEAFPLWETAGLIGLAVLLCIGLLTPLACIVWGFAQIAMLFSGGGDAPQFAFSFCVTLALLLLGPGAFSIDGRLFGRRLIRPSGSQ